jgi:DnaA family protein
MIQQLILPLQHPGQNTFSNFHPGGNTELLRTLQALLQDSDGHIIAVEGKLGKTHLLQASAHFGIQQGWRVSYLPLRKIGQFHPDLLTNSSDNPLICIDDVEVLAKEPDWQEAFLSALHLLLAKRKKVIFSQEVASEGAYTFRKDLWKKLRLARRLKIAFPNTTQGIYLLHFRARELDVHLTPKAAEFLWSAVESAVDLRRLLDFLATAGKNQKITIKMAKDWQAGQKDS